MALEEAIERGVIKEDEITQDRLEQFLSGFGRNFYKLSNGAKGKILLERKGERIPESIKSKDGRIEVALSRRGDNVFSLSWKSYLIE